MPTQRVEASIGMGQDHSLRFHSIHHVNDFRHTNNAVAITLFEFEFAKKAQHMTTVSALVANVRSPR